jgi:prohibitin 2
MNRSGGEAFARLAQQLNRARLQASGGGGGKGGGGMPGGFKGFMAGGGLLAVLAGGGLILNYSLFNGKPTVADVRHSTNIIYSRWWSSSDQIF